jgi:hypothetical protein
VTLTQFYSLLTPYERNEILEWKEIYFAGSATVEKVGSSKRQIGADLHDLYNVLGTIADQDGQAYNHGNAL